MKPRIFSGKIAVRRVLYARLFAEDADELLDRVVVRRDVLLANRQSSGSEIELGLATTRRAAPWSAVAERGTSADTAFGAQTRDMAQALLPAIPSEGVVALTLSAALQGAAREVPGSL